jgi:predicted nucleic acid-binding protein
VSVVFADTAYYLALLAPRDVWHERAVALSESLHCPVVTTAWVLTEVGDALAAPVERPNFLHLLAELRGDTDVTIVPASQELFDRGVDLFARRPDKDWSLTDCISFAVMRQRGLTDALTADQHFEQAGFTVLLK